jgi:hypothetical protein
MTNELSISTKILIGFVLAIVLYCILAYNNCRDTSIFWFKMSKLLGIDNSYVCKGPVRGYDYNHAWLRIGNTNIETTTLNLYKSPRVDYINPLFVLDDIEQINNLI